MGGSDLKEVVTNTLEEYEALDILITAAHKAHRLEDEPEKLAWHPGTIRWKIAKQRLDGKWGAKCCGNFDYSGYTTEEHDPANYPVEEE